MADTGTGSISRLARSDLSSAVTATSRAFWPDPMFGFFARTPLQEHLMLPHFIGAVMRDAMAHGEIDAITRDGRVVAAASWLRPGETPRGWWREARISARSARALLRGQNRLKGLAILDQMATHHPTEPHWYLALLGVDPAHQGSGLGGQLLRSRLARCDEQGVAAYLETQKPDNLPFYERFGFAVTKEITVAGCPSVWLMWREPRA